ncbi:uncharacterized protein BJ212DRAFT_1497077 [Suillus subaureus]|uniref:CxC2-like cysteine cluster KDZ transposase-associated domain-containing protein n=1 Tax=Suillus subaureus TaxID=48587 RepID=A0A9P7EEF1_9AGAM|nr:uncharacterized protein BJ212DRAFT_1497077 [Suillus subaureus]KAG1818518.1 hypothetical protein BJ212DRAFT_1497077 [Suillus subaureus]
MSNPKTAVTFHVLEHYHLLSFESKVSAFEFYNVCSWMSNNNGLLPIKVNLLFQVPSKLIQLPSGSA